MRAVARIRMKYQSFATPVGQVDLAARWTTARGKRNKKRGYWDIGKNASW